MSSSEFHTGLLVAGKLTQIPLKDVSVNATINCYLVGLDSRLKYSNDGADPLEVVFRFPVEESFAVVGLEAIIAGRRIKADLQEKEEAQQAYDDALASGFTAALGEEKSGDIFSISLGNLPPKSEAELHLKLVGELPIDAEGGVRFTLPSVLKPRYTPIGSTDPLANVGGGAEVSQASAPAVFNFKLEVLDADSVSEVTSPTHTITSATERNRVQVSLGKGGPLNKDLVIVVQFKEPHVPKAIPEAGDNKLSGDRFLGSPAIMLTFFPKFSSTTAACEFVFVVDRSGSMRGAYIRSARETLVLFLKSIPPGCHFNILGFGSRYLSLFPKSVPYNQENLDKAMKHAETMEADLGGTELLGPLQHIFKQPLFSGLPRQVFVLTDGSVSNTHACIQEVKKNVKYSRVFTFGIGSGASTALVKGLARAGNGTAEFVQQGERMQPKVICSLKRALQPSVTDLKVEFKVPKQYEVTQSPSKPPTIFNGDKVVIYGIFKHKSKSKPGQQQELGGHVILKGRILEQPLEYSIPFEIPKCDPQPSEDSFTLPIVHQLAAKSLIQDWQNGEGLQGFSADKRKKGIIDLSTEASVVSVHTAFVAVDEEQDKPIEGAIKTWDITAAMAEQEGSHFFGMMPCMLSAQGVCSFSSMGGGRSGAVLSAPPLPPAALGAPPPPPGASFERSLPQSVRMFEMAADSECVSFRRAKTNSSTQVTSSQAKLKFDRNVFEELSPSQSHPALPKLKLSSTSDNYTVLISLQQAEGSWQLNSTLASALTKPLKELESSCPVPYEGNIRVMWATILALAFLETVCAAQQDEWELVAFKAEMWLQGQSLPSGVDMNALKEAAKKCF